MKNTKRSPFYKLRRWKYHWQVRLKYRRTINRANRPIKLVVGAGLTEFQDWIATDHPFFDVTNRKHWKFLFSKIKPDNLLAEHVMEHLTVHQVEKALENANEYLHPGGCCRIAVPDKNHLNPQYIEHVRPGGSGPGCDDHKSFWDYKSLGQVAKNAGFRVELQEYYNENKEFILIRYPLERGLVNRSQLNPKFSSPIKGYSSLIIDCIKE